jgi:topoisomerase-4 subunit B
MSEDTRRLVQLLIDDNKAVDELLDMLLSKRRSQDRKAWLEVKGALAEIT